MIRNAIFAIAAVAAIAGAATTAQAGYYGHGGYKSHGYSSYNVYKPSFHYVRKCHKVKVGHRKVYDPYSYSYFFKPIFKTRCKRVKVWH